MGLSQEYFKKRDFQKLLGGHWLQSLLWKKLIKGGYWVESGPLFLSVVLLRWHVCSAPFSNYEWYSYMFVPDIAVEKQPFYNIFNWQRDLNILCKVIIAHSTKYSRSNTNITSPHFSPDQSSYATHTFYSNLSKISAWFVTKGLIHAMQRARPSPQVVFVTDSETSHPMACQSQQPPAPEEEHHHLMTCRCFAEAMLLIT